MAHTYEELKKKTVAELRDIAADIQHANMPIGPIGRQTELHLAFPMMLFKYSKYPNAAKEYLRFMMEKEQYEPWQQAAIGYVTQPLKAYESNPIWTVDPKHTPYRDAMKIMIPNGYAGTMGYASAAAMADCRKERRLKRRSGAFMVICSCQLTRCVEEFSI